MALFPRTLAAAAVLIAGSVGVAQAASVTGAMVVSATVLDTCVVTVPVLPFGNYSGTELDAQADVSVTCTGSTGWVMDINAGGSGDIASREMSGTTDALSYQLYTDASRSTVFGDGVTGSTISNTGSGVAQTVTVYGRVPASQYPQAGAYSDTVTVQITY